MRISIVTGFALAALVAVAIPSPPIAESASPPATFTPAAELQPGSVVKLLSKCRRLSIAAYRTADTAKLDAYIEELFKDQRGNRDEILACASYLVGAGDSGFYLPDPQ